jgi:hypothetical protein
MSTGHAVMIVSGLLAAVLTYAVLRQAAGVGAEESVAAGDIHAGQVVTTSMFATANVKAPSSALSGVLTPEEIPGVSGQVAVVDVRKGQLVARQFFRPATPPPPRMAIDVDPETIPGGAPALVPGSKIDLVAVDQAGQPLLVPGLVVLKTPDSGGDRSLGAATTVRIDVAVPDPTTAQMVLAATSSGKFAIRVAGAPGAG